MFKKDQNVWCAIFGAGVVKRIRQESGVEYPVVVLVNSNNDDDEFVATYTNDGKYHYEGNVTLFPYPIEITKAITKPSIDWTQIKDEYKWLAVDVNECAYVYENEPNIDGSTFWCSSSATYFLVNGLVSYSRGTCDWKDSLIERPKI